MKIKKIDWDHESKPSCQNGDIVVLVQYGEAEIAKYITPKPVGAPQGDGDFVFEICDNDEDGLEDEVFKAIEEYYPVVITHQDNPLLFICPGEFAKKAIWAL